MMQIEIIRDNDVNNFEKGVNECLKYMSIRNHKIIDIKYFQEMIQEEESKDSFFGEEIEITPVFVYTAIVEYEEEEEE